MSEKLESENQEDVNLNKKVPEGENLKNETDINLSIKKLNIHGLQLLEYKKELLKNHTQLVKESLLLSLQKMVEKELITPPTFEVIINDNISLIETKNYLLEISDYVKSKEEALREYNLYKTKLYKTLVEREIIINKSLYKLEVDEENDTIDLIKTFSIDAQFTKLYFNITSEKELNKVMKPKGFLEKFAALRLNSLVASFVKEYEEFDTNKFTIIPDKTYREEDGLGYSIEIIIKINPFFLEKEGRFEQTIISLENLIKLIDDYFAKRTII